MNNHLPNPNSCKGISNPALGKVPALTTLIAAMACLASIGLAHAQTPVSEVTKVLSKKYKGTTIHLLGLTGPLDDVNAALAKEFEDATGIQVVSTGLSYQEMHQQMILDLTSGTNSFDAV